jgi:hypothetical protein
MRNINTTMKCVKGRQGEMLIVHIGKGWKEFTNENKFKFGDELLFILVFTNSINIRTSLYKVICKKFCMLLLQDHSGRMVVLVPFQRFIDLLETIVTSAYLRIQTQFHTV